MPNYKIEVLTEDGTWGDKAFIEGNLPRFVSFKLQPGGCDVVKIHFPIEGDVIGASDEKYTKLNSLTQRTNWNKATLKNIEPALDMRIDKAERVIILTNTIHLDADVTFDISITGVDPGINQTSVALCDTKYLNYDEKESRYITVATGQVMVNVINIPGPPVIKAFTTSCGVGIKDQPFLLSWTATGHDSLLLEVDTGTSSPIKETLEAGTQFSERKLSSSVIYKLIATNSHTGLNAEKILKIESARNPGSGNLQNLFDNGRLMNLVKASETLMYGLVETQNKDNVWLWQTTDGANWNKTDISFGNKVPIAYAGSSCVWCNNKLYLIGGSLYDPNTRGDAMYFFDFLSKASGWQAENTCFSARMGQAAVVVNNGAAEEIYLLGGHGAGGTCNDIWIYNSISKWRRGKNIHQGICMHSAIYSEGKLQVFGGFTHGPGTPDQTITESVYSADLGQTWQNFPGAEKLSGEKDKKIISGAVAVYNDVRYFTGFYLNGKTEKLHRVLKITKGAEMGLVDYTTIDPVLPEVDCVSVQAVIFKEVIWLTMLSDDDPTQTYNLSYVIHKPISR